MVYAQLSCRRCIMYYTSASPLQSVLSTIVYITLINYCKYVYSLATIDSFTDGRVLIIYQQRNPKNIRKPIISQVYYTYVFVTDRRISIFPSASLEKFFYFDLFLSFFFFERYYDLRNDSPPQPTVLYTPWVSVQIIHR